MNKISKHCNLELYRFSSGLNSTLGSLYIINALGIKNFCCFTLEDRFHFPDEKVSGSTRIPAGIYKLNYKKEGGFHTRYKTRFKDIHHNGMIEIVGVPNFTDILLHCGNHDQHTKGCVLLGDTAEQNVTKKGFIGNSNEAYKRFYKEFINTFVPEVSKIKIIDGDDV